MEWVLLSYRLPREPSTPRIALWRKLRELGAEQIGDGLAALPLDARTRERFEWLAATIEEADGTAAVWQATTSRATSESIVDSMRAARDREYQALIAETEQLRAGGAPPAGRVLQRLRRTHRKIQRRDYFGATRGDEARLAMQAASAPDSAPCSP